MLSARDYVEIMTCKRLNRCLPTDREVFDQEFNEVWNKLDKLTNSLAHNNKIDGFGEDDLKGFFAMNVHQSLRRGKYDKNRPPYGFFKTNFDNLLRNLVREIENTEKKLSPREDLYDFITDSDLFDGFHSL